MCQFLGHVQKIKGLRFSAPVPTPAFPALPRKLSEGRAGSSSDTNVNLLVLPSSLLAEQHLDCLLRALKQLTCENRIVNKQAFLFLFFLNQMTFQFSMWDKIRDLGNLSTTAVSNLVNLLAHLLKTKSLSLTVFKVSKTLVVVVFEKLYF